MTELRTPGGTELAHTHLGQAWGWGGKKALCTGMGLPMDSNQALLSGLCVDLAWRSLYFPVCKIHAWSHGIHGVVVRIPRDMESYLMQAWHVV